MIHTRNGSYNLDGMGDIQLPSLDDLLKAAQGAVTGQLANAVVNSADVQKAAAQGASEAFGQKFYKFITEHKKPLIYGGVAVGVLVTAYIATKMVKK